MPTRYEDHEGIEIPVGSKVKAGRSVIEPTQDGWAGTRREATTKKGATSETRGGKKGD